MTEDETAQRPTLLVGGVRLRPGDLLRIGREASVQFSGASGFILRLIRVQDWPTYDGWTWLEGYQLDDRGEAVDRRTIFVRVAGLRVLRPPARRRPPPAERRLRADRPSQPAQRR